MDLFTRLNRKCIDDRQIDTLIGIGKGLIADGKVDQGEAEFLMSWLVQARSASDNPIILNLLQRVSAMLEDGFLDPDESAELLSLLRKVAGEPSEVGELAKSAALPIYDPLPPIEFPGRYFVFTGTCAFGTRRECHDATEGLGGRIATGVTKSVNYVVLGTYVTDSWIHETYGRKIEKAMKYRDEGVPLAIITEEHWVNWGRFA
ncbi:MAG: BRCT domain-containing protein [Aquisalimonadaceae bacterium]